MSLCRRRKKNPKIMRLRTATPPITPPTITPVLLVPTLLVAVLLAAASLVLVLFVLEGVDAAGAVVAAELLDEPLVEDVLGWLVPDVGFTAVCDGEPVVTGVLDLF